MSLEKKGEVPVHFPTGGSFEFDDEVAEIFPNMAERSIPLYRTMHALHAKILVDDYARFLSEGRKPYRVLDVGASRCEFYDAIEAEIRSRDLPLHGLQYMATDTSRAMIAASRKNDKGLRYRLYDISESTDVFLDGSKFEAVIMHYVMQFVKPRHRAFTFGRIGQFVVPEGLLFYGEKETLLPSTVMWGVQGEKSRIEQMADSAREHYIQFRLNNGYSLEEIESKTEALKNSMWEDSAEDTRASLEGNGFACFMPTCRIGPFHSFVALKG